MIMHQYNKSAYYVDFSNRENLTSDEKKDLDHIQLSYKPIERAEYLIPYKINGKISDDDYETMTGIPYNFG